MKKKKKTFRNNYKPAKVGKEDLHTPARREHKRTTKKRGRERKRSITHMTWMCKSHRKANGACWEREQRRNTLWNEETQWDSTRDQEGEHGDDHAARSEGVPTGAELITAVVAKVVMLARTREGQRGREWKTGKMTTAKIIKRTKVKVEEIWIKNASYDKVQRRNCGNIDTTKTLG